MAVYMWVVKVNGHYLGKDKNSITTALVAAHLFNTAAEADPYCPTPTDEIDSEVLKVVAYIEEIR